MKKVGQVARARQVLIDFQIDMQNSVSRAQFPLLPAPPLYQHTAFIRLIPLVEFIQQQLTANFRIWHMEFQLKCLRYANDHSIAICLCFSFVYYVFVFTIIKLLFD